MHSLARRSAAFTCLTAALLDRLTHRAHMLPINGESFRFRDAGQTLVTVCQRTCPHDPPRKKDRRSTCGGLCRQ